MAQELVQMETFLRNLEQHLDHHSDNPLSANTVFRDLPGWTSLQSLVMIVSFDADYGVTISADELRHAQTVGDLCSLIRHKQGA
jgi:acyl carrier protein